MLCSAVLGRYGMPRGFCTYICTEDVRRETVAAL